MQEQAITIASTPQGKKDLATAFEVVGSLLASALNAVLPEKSPGVRAYGDPDECPYGFEDDDSDSINLDMLPPQ
jgi:hypothetical protein